MTLCYDSVLEIDSFNAHKILENKKRNTSIYVNKKKKFLR